MIKFAAEMICEGASLYVTATALNDRGDRTVTGNLWSGSVLRQLLYRPHLVGHRKQGDDVWRDEHGTPIKTHEPIISEALWHRVRRTLGSRSATGKGGARRGKAQPTTLLGGVIVCDLCNAGFHGIYKPTPYYRCNTCSGPLHAVRRDLVDPYVSRAALNFLSSLDADSAIIEEVGRRWLARFTPEQLGRHEAIQGELGALRDKAAELQIAYFERSSMESDVYERLEQRLSGQIDELEKELLNTPKPSADLSPLFDLVQSSDHPDGDIIGEGSAWNSLPDHLRREIIRCLVDEVTVEHRAKPSHDIEGRIKIKFTTESNVVELADRPVRQHRTTLDMRAQVA